MGFHDKHKWPKLGLSRYFDNVGGLNQALVTHVENSLPFVVYGLLASNEIRYLVTSVIGILRSRGSSIIEIPNS